jgi:dihydrofolate reductase
MEIVLIAAVAENGVIGRAGDMPWRLKSDLARFRAVTMGKPIVMGRKTFESLGAPLKGRTNIVVTRDPAFARPGILVARDIGSALAAARGDALRRGTNEIVIGGGSDIYAAAMLIATRLDITQVAARPEGDTYFPAIDEQAWHVVERHAPPQGEGDSAPFVWLTYRRAAAPGPQGAD